MAESEVSIAQPAITADAVKAAGARENFFMVTPEDCVPRT